jgi:VWFA-related protein
MKHNQRSIFSLLPCGHRHTGPSPLWHISLLVLLISIAGLHTSLLGQDISSEQMPTLTVRSQLVALDVVVTDKKGNVVTNLGRDDFSVYENGTLQQIRNFEGPPERHPIPVTASKDKSGNEDWGDAPLTMLVIDALNTPFDEAAYTRHQAEQYLKAQPSPLIQPTMILWLNDAGFHPISSFTRDREALLAALGAQKASLPSKLANGAGVEQLSASLSALQQIALFSRGQKGTKEIIWMGRSFPDLDGTQLNTRTLDIFHKAVRSTIDLLLESKATVYVVDPTLMTSITDPSTSAITDPATILPFSATDPFLESFSFTSFVQQTGGKYFYGRNDLNKEVAESVERGTSFYSLSYVPSTPIEDNVYRQIDIHLRDPNLVVQAKKGYYPVSADDTALTSKDLQFDLYEASVTGMAYTGLGVRLDSCTATRYPAPATCNVIVDNDSLTFNTGPGGEQRAKITAVISAISPKEALITNKVSEMEVGVPSLERPSGGLGVTKFPLHLAIPHTAKSIRVVVRDSSGRIGTADLDAHSLAAPSK